MRILAILRMYVQPLQNNSALFLHTPSVWRVLVIDDRKFDWVQSSNCLPSL